MSSLCTFQRPGCISSPLRCRYQVTPDVKNPAPSSSSNCLDLITTPTNPERQNPIHYGCNPNLVYKNNSYTRPICRKNKHFFHKEANHYLRGYWLCNRIHPPHPTCPEYMHGKKPLLKNRYTEDMTKNINCALFLSLRSIGDKRTIISSTRTLKQAWNNSMTRRRVLSLHNTVPVFSENFGVHTSNWKPCREKIPLCMTRPSPSSRLTLQPGVCEINFPTKPIAFFHPSLKFIPQFYIYPEHIGNLINISLTEHGVTGNRVPNCRIYVFFSVEECSWYQRKKSPTPFSTPTDLSDYCSFYRNYMDIRESSLAFFVGKDKTNFVQCISKLFEMSIEDTSKLAQIMCTQVWPQKYWEPTCAHCCCNAIMPTCITALSNNGKIHPIHGNSLNPAISYRYHRSDATHYQWKCPSSDPPKAAPDMDSAQFKFSPAFTQRTYGPITGTDRNLVPF